MNTPPKWYYGVAGVATLWALMGCYAYLSQVSMTPADLARLPAAQRDAWASFPTWLTAVYAIAVWSGLAGAICLLVRLRHAPPAYLVSLVAIVVQFGWMFVATPIIANMGFVAAAAFPIFIGVAGVALFLFARTSLRRGWLR